MNSESLKTKINARAKENNVSPQELMQMYFFERLLYRVSISKYKNNFILKGGLLLAALFGDDRRTTNDMDTMIKGIDVNSKELINVIQKIINIDANDGINFQLLKYNTIRPNDKYGGTRLSLLATKEGLKVNLKIDVTTKDPIIPREMRFKYKSMFEDSYINIMSFTKESIIAEKFETLMEDVENDTRAKDFYDLYMLMKEDINYNNLREAILSTFKRREKTYILEELEERFLVVKNSTILALNWERFRMNHNYAMNIEYSDIINTLNNIIGILIKITV